MTKEEFRIEFSQAVAEDDTELFEMIRDDSAFAPYVALSNKGLDTLTNIAEVVAEPLFEEIERLKGDNSTLTTLSAKFAKENLELRDENLRRHGYISALESDVKTLHDLAKSRQNEIDGLQQMYHDAEARAVYQEASNKTLLVRIDILEEDIAELIYCEECGEDCERLAENGCYPPRFCHRCRYPELYTII